MLSNWDSFLELLLISIQSTWQTIINHTCYHWVRNCFLCLLSPMLGTEQCHPETWNIETVWDLCLVDSTIVIYNVHNEGALSSYCQSCANAIAFFNLPELEILEMVLVGWHCDQIMIFHTNQERVRIKLDASCSWLYRLNNEEPLNTYVRDVLYVNMFITFPKNTENCWHEVEGVWK